MSGITKSMLIERIAIHISPAPQGCRVGGEGYFRPYKPPIGRGGRIELRGFGSFSLHKRKARSEEIRKQVNLWCWIQKQFPTLSQGKELREAVNTVSGSS